MFSSYLFLAATASTTATCNTAEEFEASWYELHTFPKETTARYEIVRAIISSWDAGRCYSRHFAESVKN